MNSPLNTSTGRIAKSRVLWVTRRYWPHAAGQFASGSTALAMTRALADLGHAVEVLTPRYHTHWSTEFQFDRIRVHRVATSPSGEWATQRYVRQLTQWIGERANRFDSIVCDGLIDDIRAVAMNLHHTGPDTASQGTRPQGINGPNGMNGPNGIVRLNGWGDDADEVACRRNRGEKRILQAAAMMNRFVTRNATTDRYLIANGIARERLTRVPIGFPRPAKVDPRERVAARRALASANTDLAAEVDDRVLLWCGTMAGRNHIPARGAIRSEALARGAGLIAASARLLCSHYRHLRIWMLGDGPLHDWLHSELKAEGVRNLVAIPGTFPDMSDIWRAVDAVAITGEDQLRYTLPTAIGLGLPVVIEDLASLRGWTDEALTADVAGSLAWYERDKPKSFRRAVRLIWDDFPAAIEHAWEVAMEANRRSSQTQEWNTWSEIVSPKNPMISS